MKVRKKAGENFILPKKFKFDIPEMKIVGGDSSQVIYKFDTPGKYSAVSENTVFDFEIISNAEQIEVELPKEVFIGEPIPFRIKIKHKITSLRVFFNEEMIHSAKNLFLNEVHFFASPNVIKEFNKISIRIDGIYKEVKEFPLIIKCKEVDKVFRSELDYIFIDRLHLSLEDKVKINGSEIPEEIEEVEKTSGGDICEIYRSERKIYSKIL